MTTIAELRRLLEAATPGPWEAFGPRPTGSSVDSASGHIAALRARRTRPVYKPQGEARLPVAAFNDAALIAAAVNALPALLVVAEAAREYRLAGDHLAELEAKNRLDAALAALEKVKP